MKENLENEKNTRSPWPRILGISAILLVILVVLGAWWVRHNLYAGPFGVTKLSEREQKVLDAKIDRLERSAFATGRVLKPEEGADAGRLEPERYREDPEKREIRITEKELNSLIARDGEMARRMAVDLSDDTVSLKLLVPLEEDFPLFGGKTIRLHCGVTFRQEGPRPVVALQGVSIGGIPVPNAWLGSLKNVDLVQEFGGQLGFWSAFSEGVEDVKVSEGALFIRLKE